MFTMFIFLKSLFARSMRFIGTICFLKYKLLGIVVSKFFAENNA